MKESIYRVLSLFLFIYTSTSGSGQTVVCVCNLSLTHIHIYKCRHTHTHTHTHITSRSHRYAHIFTSTHSTYKLLFVVIGRLTRTHKNNSGAGAIRITWMHGHTNRQTNTDKSVMGFCVFHLSVLSSRVTQYIIGPTLYSLPLSSISNLSHVTISNSDKHAIIWWQEKNGRVLSLNTPIYTT